MSLYVAANLQLSVLLLTQSPVESVGYVGRALSAQEAPDFTKNPYIIQSLLLLLGPALLAASIYMVLGRLIRLLDAGDLSIISPRWLTKVFVAGDVMSFLAQSAGTYLEAIKLHSTNSQRWWYASNSED
jgi:hypothetical protein